MNQVLLYKLTYSLTYIIITSSDFVFRFWPAFFFLFYLYPLPFSINSCLLIVYAFCYLLTHAVDEVGYYGFTQICMC